MKKIKFLSVFLSLSMLMIPCSKANVIKPAVRDKLRNALVYKNVKIGLERSIASALRDATPKSDELLIKLFGAYCLVVANHTHCSPIKTYCVRVLGFSVRIAGNSVQVPGVRRAKIPKDISKAFTLQQKIRAKLQQNTTFWDIIPSTPIITWAYGGQYYLCNPDLVYKQLPKRYRQDYLDYVEIFSNFAVTPTMYRSRTC
ncbi:MAG: hypothetical protein IKE41_02140 [Clostridia bacterium]|nr:hypothetical protein [Clostridia bacterium]